MVPISHNVNTTTDKSSSPQEVRLFENRVQQEAKAIIAANENQQILTDVIIDQETYLPRKLVNHNIDAEHFAASVNKVPVSVLVLEKLRNRAISLDTVLTWDPSDVRGGAGVFDQPGAPTSGTVRDVLKDMLHYSGNTSVRVAVNQILGGAPAVNTTWKQRYGLEHTYLMPLEGEGQRFYLGNTNARESMKMLKKLTVGIDRYSQLVRDYMSTNIWDQMGVRSVIGDTGKMLVINKIGYLDDPDGNNRHDVGIVINKHTGKSFSYAFLETAPAASSTATPQADSALQQLGVTVLKAAGDSTAAQKPQPQELRRSAATPAPDQGKVLY